MSESTEAPRPHVLTLEVLHTALDVLRGQRIHEHFPAYLHVRQRAFISRSLTDITPDWNALAEHLDVPGGPPTKPHYRPFSSRRTKDPGNYWLNPNLAGSYAPASVRKTSQFMLDPSGKGYALSSDHAQHARKTLLFDRPVPAWALAAFYLRDYGFNVPTADEASSDVLLSAFRQQFHFRKEDRLASEAEYDADLSVHADFGVLFETATLPSLSGTWFEVLPHVTAAGDVHA